MSFSWWSPPNWVWYNFVVSDWFTLRCDSMTQSITPLQHVVYLVLCCFMPLSFNFLPFFLDLQHMLHFISPVSPIHHVTSSPFTYSFPVPFHMYSSPDHMHVAYAPSTFLHLVYLSFLCFSDSCVYILLHFVLIRQQIVCKLQCRSLTTFNC